MGSWSRQNCYLEAVFSAPCYCLAVAMIISSRFLLASKVADELVISRSVKFKKALRFVPGRHSHSQNSLLLIFLLKNVYQFYYTSQLASGIGLNSVPTLHEKARNNSVRHFTNIFSGHKKRLSDIDRNVRRNISRILMLI